MYARGRCRPRPHRRLRRPAVRPDPAAVPLVHRRPAVLQPLRRRRATPPPGPSATAGGSASTSPTPSWPPTTRASRSPRPSTCWPRTPTTSTSSTPPASTARASRSATVRSTGHCSPVSSTSTRPGSGSSPRSGRATSTTARASGSPWSGWSSGSDDGRTVPTPAALWAVPVSDLGGVPATSLDVVRAGLPGWRLVVLCPPGTPGRRGARAQVARWSRCPSARSTA